MGAADCCEHLPYGAADSLMHLSYYGGTFTMNSIDKSYYPAAGSADFTSAAPNHTDDRSLYNRLFSDYSLPEYKDIPDIGLLLEQTVKLVNGYLEPFSGIRLTSSMVSNYVKQRIISRPVRKLYYREQIAALIFIALSKTVLSLEDTTKFLTMQRSFYPADTAYNYFCLYFEKTLKKKFTADDDPSSVLPAGITGSRQYLVSCLAVSIVECIHLKLRIAESDLQISLCGS